MSDPNSTLYLRALEHAAQQLLDEAAPHPDPAEWPPYETARRNLQDLLDRRLDPATYLRVMFEQGGPA